MAANAPTHPVAELYLCCSQCCEDIPAHIAAGDDMLLILVDPHECNEVEPLRLDEHRGNARRRSGPRRDDPQRVTLRSVEDCADTN